MDKARVITTLRCDRKCPNCSTTDMIGRAKLISNPNDLLDYKEIIITGGEPCKIPKNILEFVQRLNDVKYNGKVYLYSALYNNELRDFYKVIFRYIHGLHYTVHYESTDADIVALKQLSEVLIQYCPDYISLRLSIDSRLYDKYDFSNINFNGWSVVRKLQWKEHCPLPPGEELLLYFL